jgi:hypothetical protein
LRNNKRLRFNKYQHHPEEAIDEKTLTPEKLHSLIRSGPSPAFDRFIPNEFAVSLYYAQVNDYTSGLSQSQIFRGNDLYDPDFSGAGSQPLGFDEYMALYQNFRVVRSHCEMSVCSNAGGIGILASLVPLLTTTAYGSQAGAIANPFAKYELVGNATGMNKCKISHTFDTHAIYGLKKNVVDYDDGFWGTSSSSPAKQWFWRIELGTANGTQSCNSDLVVRIRYDVIFFNRTQLVLS